MSECEWCSFDNPVGGLKTMRYQANHQNRTGAKDAEGCFVNECPETEIQVCELCHAKGGSVRDPLGLVKTLAYFANIIRRDLNPQTTTIAKGK